MQSPVDDSNQAKSTLAWQSALPPVFWGLPFVYGGFFASCLFLDAAAMPPILLDLLAGLYVFWLVCVWRMHRSLSVQTAGAYPIKPALATMFNIVAGPFAAYFALQVCELMRLAVTKSADLISDVLPNSLPIANSATTLMNDYGVFLAVAIACGAAVSSQVRLVLCMRDFAALHGQSIGQKRAMAGAAATGIALAVPGCLWLLANAAMPEVTAPLDAATRARLLVCSYAGALVAFCVLSWLQRTLSNCTGNGR